MSYSPANAKAKAKIEGFSRVHLDDRRTVTLHIDWLSSGKEIMVFRLARGEFKGMRVGVAYRD